ncbi:hypothetical protein [Herbaspirillum camelliae]|uniref:hypothetical protein n=1 Tax=Herbaspirillum camelliae TaxID=1892903 RepID=UPI000949DE1C|nr:hypothetical protein [Herbaspirillum camelliae]
MNAINPSQFAMEAGARLRMGNIVFEITEVKGSRLAIEHCLTHERKWMNQDAFWAAYTRGDLVPYRETASIAPEDLQEQMQDIWKGLETTGGMLAFGEKARSVGLRCIAYIREMNKLGHTTMRPTNIKEIDYDRLTKQKGDVHPPKLSTLYSCERKIERAGGDLHAAFPQFSRRGGGGKSRIARVVKDAIDKVLRRLAGKNTKVRFTEVQKDVQHELNETLGREKALALQPSLTTVTRETKRCLGEFELCRRNKSLEVAKQKFRDWYPRDRATFTGQVVECDDKDTGVFAVDSRTGLPYGRIWVTSAVEQLSNVPTGLKLGASARNTESAIGAVINAVMPKVRGSGDYAQVSNEIPYMGMPSLFIFDNTRYNHSLRLSAAVITVSNAAIEFARPWTPTEKTTMENFNGMMLRYLENLPGYVGPKKHVRDTVEEGMNSAVLTTDQFRQGFMKWVYDVHCHTPGIDGFTPHERYLRGMEGRRARLPSNVHDIELAGLRPHSVQLRPVGVEFYTGLRYHHAVFAIWRKAYGEKLRVEFRFNPDDLSFIWVKYPKGAQEVADNPHMPRWLRAESTNLAYSTGLTLFQHKLIVKMARARRNGHPGMADMLKSRNDLIVLTEQMSTSKKLRERKVAANVGDLPAMPDSEESTTAAEEAPAMVDKMMTDIEAKLREIDQVTLAPEDEDEWAQSGETSSAFA